MIANIVFANDIDLDRAVWDPDYRHEVMRRLKIEAARLAGGKGRQRAARPAGADIETPPRNWKSRKLLAGAA